jgi:hypothetical protein
MPVLLWVAFWSSLMGTAACLGEVRPARAVVSKQATVSKQAVPKQRDLSSGD